MKSLVKLLQRPNLVVGDIWVIHRGRENDYKVKITSIGKNSVSYGIVGKYLTGNQLINNFYRNFRKV